MLYADRIEELRAMMRSRGWDAVVLTGSDPHGSEYPAERWKCVQWLTGFTGEAGDVVVTLDHAGLWTDTRYFIQAVQQLEGTGVELHKMRVPEQVPIPQWLAQHFEGEDEAYIALDGLCVSSAFAAEIKAAGRQTGGDGSAAAQSGQAYGANGTAAGFGTAFHIVSIPNLIDAIWEDRPQIPQTPVFQVDPGESRANRLGRLREWLEENRTDYILLSALDEIAWTLNVRASDIEFNPLVISFLLVGRETADWFVLKEPVEDPQTDETFAALADDGVVLRYYEEIEIALSDLDGTVAAGGLSYHLSSLLGPARLKAVDTPVQRWKAVKNNTEVAGIRRAHFADGLAMEQFLFWLEKSLANDRVVTEWDAAVKLGALRADIPEYRGDSFETISAWGPGAALPHYITPHSGAPVLEPRGLYLCDSGGQYWADGSFGGTTDITRTVPLGPCSRVEMEDYTLVLKGHIQLAMAVFPYGTPGCRIDALAREPLWKARRSFGHGTGHGVGWFLGVHEGPQDVRQNLNAEALVPGMIISDEPGIYREGSHGVRHENLLLCIDAGTDEFAHWCAFEPLTLCHFDTSALILEMLTPDERDWLNSYNSMVYASLAPELPGPVAEWLREKTRAI